MTEKELMQKITVELELRIPQVVKTIELLDSDNTVPFIARYRKEMTGSLDEEQIRAVRDRMKYLRNLEERKNTVLKSIEEQGKLTPELEEKIRAAEKLQEVEDLYRPYKPKKRTRGTIAKEKGLEPLAEMILSQDITEGDPLQFANQFINEEKGVTSPEEALAGARDIVAESVSDDAEVRQIIRTRVMDKGLFSSLAIDESNLGDYEVYADFAELMKTIPPYRVLAMNRGERENFLRVWVDSPYDMILESIKFFRITNADCIFTEDYQLAIEDGYQRLINPSIQREIRKALTKKSDMHAIHVFAQNLKSLLMTPPMRNKRILGIDPGFRTGSKIAVIDETGRYLEGSVIYPHPPQNQWDESKETLVGLIQKYKVHIVAIGNGTASRETEKLVAELIGEIDDEVQYIIVNEAGASVYSASPVAKKEFPDLEASTRGNISIARRLLDPLSELVKIDPKSIGVGLYQHDVDQMKLADQLDQVVESCVNAVGVDVNTASASLLKYIAGINSRVAENIVALREENGRITARKQLHDVKGLGDHAFLQAAGFIRIPESDVFFDETAVHPESYDNAQKLLELLALTIQEIKEDGSRLRQKIKEKGETLESLAKILECGRETLQDIVDCLEKPQRDPREYMQKPILRSDILTMDDLQEGMILNGTVRNVVDFGAFVDIGVKQDGLVHISQMANKFIKNPLDVVSVGDVVRVKIMSIDKERNRIGLSMILE